MSGRVQSVDRLLQPVFCHNVSLTWCSTGPVIRPLLISRLYLGLYSEHPGFFFWPPYGIRHAIIFFPVVSIFLVSFFSPNLSCRRLDVYHTATHGGLSANLDCNACLKTCCTPLAETQDSKIAKNRHLHGHHQTDLSGYIFDTKAPTIEKNR